MTERESHQRNKSMVVHGAIGALPVGNLFEGFHAGRYLTGGSVGVGMLGSALSVATYPMGGSVAAGVYHGYAKNTKGVKYWKTSSKGKRYQARKPGRRKR